MKEKNRRRRRRHICWVGHTRRSTACRFSPMLHKYLMIINRNWNYLMNPFKYSTYLIACIYYL